MKERMTVPEIRRRYRHVIDGGNCRWQRLPVVCRWDCVGYTAGTYGWNCDVFGVTPHTCIVSGDRPPDGNLEVDLMRMRKYENEAVEALTRLGTDYVRRRAALSRKVLRYIRRLEDAADARGAGRTPARHG